MRPATLLRSSIMKLGMLGCTVLIVAQWQSSAALAQTTPGQTAVKHFPASGSPIAPSAGATKDPGPAFSSAVLAGDTLYVSGTVDVDPATGKPPTDPKDGARMVLDKIKQTVEGAGLSMNDLVWVQVFASDLANYGVFNEVYRTYFTGPLPARAMVGAGSLLGGAHFEVMGIAVKAKK
jgi:2-iminobutanoate/2-iminopropanoate deaminase